MKRIQQIVNNENHTNKYLAVLISSLLLFIFLLPVMSHANPYSPLVTCGNDPGVLGPTQGSRTCTFNDFIETINRIINWIISIAGVIFTISAVWGGFLYMTSGENEGNKKRAKDILLSTLYGFVIILCAWLIVYTILRYLVVGGTGNSIFRFIGSGR